MQELGLEMKLLKAVHLLFEMVLTLLSRVKNEIASVCHRYQQRFSSLPRKIFWKLV